MNLQKIRCLDSVWQVMLHAWWWKSIRLKEMHLKAAVSSSECRLLLLGRRQVPPIMHFLKCAMQEIRTSMDSMFFQRIHKDMSGFIWGFQGFCGSVSSTSPANYLGPLGAGFHGSHGSLVLWFSGSLVPLVLMVPPVPRVLWFPGFPWCL